MSEQNNNNSDSGNCPICKVSSNKFCSACKKVYYCSANHQKEDRKIHKKDCFPAMLILNDILGRHFAATKDLRAGDLIFKDKACVSGPSGAEPLFHKICLGCYMVVKSGYKCSKCKWPVCNLKCEKVKHHAEAECGIFAREGICPYFTESYQYDFIKILRTLLVRDVDGNKWREITNAASHDEKRMKNKEALAASNATFHFTNRICKLDQFDFKIVHQIVGIWGVNSFGANPPSTGSCPTGSLASFIFPRTSLASHNCIANTRGILREENLDGAPVYSMELRASLPIKSGSPIFITYADVSEGTFERRQVLLDNYYFSCTCDRCQDPTEFGTYSNAFKCTKCPKGHLLMLNPLDFETIWMCDQCPETTHYKDLVTRIFKIRTQMLGLEKDNRVNIEILTKILAQNQGSVLHTNHWLLMEVEFQLIQYLLVEIRKSKVKESAELENLIHLCSHCLSIANIIRPGHNTYRAKILYCLCQAKLECILRGTVANSGIKTSALVDTANFLLRRRATLEEAKSFGEEAAEILSYEPQQSEEGRMVQGLRQDLRKIQGFLTALVAEEAKIQNVSNVNIS